MYTIQPDDDNWDSDSNHAVVLGVHKSPNGISDGCCIAYKAADVTHLSDLVLPVTLPYTREVKVVNVTVLPDNSGSLFGLNRVYCHEGKVLSLDPKCFPMLQGELDEAEEQMTSQAGTKCPVTKFCGKIYSHAQKADWSVASVVTSDLNDYAFLEDAGVFAIGFWGISTMGIETLNLACNYFVTGNGMNFGTKGYPHFLVLNVNGVIEVGLADEKLGIYVPMKEPSFTLGTATTDLVVNTSPGMVTIDLPKLRGGDIAAKVYNGVTNEDFLTFARIVAYKVGQNLDEGFTLDLAENPLTIDGVPQTGLQLDPPLESHKLASFNPKVSDPGDEQEVARTNVSMAAATLTKCFKHSSELCSWLAGEISGTIQFGGKVDEKTNREATSRLLQHLFLNDYTSYDTDSEVCRENVDLAFSILGEAFNDDPDFAWSWHCNIAMPIQDAGVDYMDSNWIAAQIMMHLFGVDTTANVNFDIVQANRQNAYSDTFNVAAATTGRIDTTNPSASNPTKSDSDRPRFTVAVFNNGNSAITVDDGCYVIRNLIDDMWKPATHIFAEALVALNSLPKNPRDAQYNDKEQEQSPTDSYSVRHAKREFLALGYKPVEDEEEGPNKWVQENVIELLDVFAAQGHSGFSAPWVISYFEKLARHEPLCPLTGDDSEWNDTTEMGSELTSWQNLRCGRVFKDLDGNAFDSTGIIFEHGPNTKFPGSCYTGSRTLDGITYSSRVPITFPYTPTQVRMLVDDEGVPLDHAATLEAAKERDADARAYANSTQGE